MAGTMTLEEWRAEARRLGGDDFLDTPFVCPLCGNVATPRQFEEAGAEGSRAPQECIGRVTGAKGGLRSKTPKAQPCDWASFGLLRTLNGGTTIVKPDGTTADVFDFAPEH